MKEEKFIEYYTRYRNCQTIKNDRRHLVLACFPKSGSTYLSRFMALLPDFEYVSLTLIREDNEQEFNPDLLILNHDKNWVAQSHTRPSQFTDFHARIFDLDYIVLTRNLYDCIVSIQDHWARDNQNGPIAAVPDDWRNWDEDKVYRFVADMFVPWYMTFFVRWQQRRDAVMWLTYEDFFADPAANMRRIVDRYGIAASDAQVRNAFDAMESVEGMRRNVGETGRGKRIPASVRARIECYRDYYPDVDWSVIGV